MKLTYVRTTNGDFIGEDVVQQTGRWQLRGAARVVETLGHREEAGAKGAERRTVPVRTFSIESVVPTARVAVNAALPPDAVWCDVPECPLAAAYHAFRENSDKASVEARMSRVETPAVGTKTGPAVEAVAVANNAPAATGAGR